MSTLAQAMKEIALCEAMRFPQVRHVTHEATHENYTQADLAEANGDDPIEPSVEELEDYFRTLEKAQRLYPAKPFVPKNEGPF